MLGLDHLVGAGDRRRGALPRVLGRYNDVIGFRQRLDRKQGQDPYGPRADDQHRATVRHFGSQRRMDRACKRLDYHRRLIAHLLGHR